jgi:hypothetical protein
MRYLSLLFLLCVGCSTIRQKRLMRHAIIYTVFDSAEKYFVHQIQDHAPDKPIGIIIDPYYDLHNNDLRWFDNDRFGMAVVFKLENYGLQEKILDKSDRYMKIGNYFLPVYIMYIDDPFQSSYYGGELHRGLAGDTSRVGYRMTHPPIYYQDSILVNITNKTFEDGYRNRKRKALH